VPDKGQMLLLRAVAQLRDDGVAVTLTLIGDGPDRAALERAARRLNLEECVEFTGSLGQPEVAERFQSADVFCLPSFAEGLPVVLMEAMSHGLPVIATRIAGVAELVEDGVSGALVSAARIDQLVAALGRLADEPELRRRWGDAGRARVLRDYDVNQSARVLARLFSGADADDVRPVDAAPELEAVAL
jgi:glycosyltransferase involved in cell wall biosynthesis